MSGSRLMAWWAGGRAQHTPEPGTMADSVETFRALREPVEVTYFGLPADAGAALRLEAALREAYPSARITRQQPLQDCRGASAGVQAPFHYIVATDVRAEAEDDFNAWYEQEHLPGLASVPGTVRAQRLRNDDDSPRYHACYDLATAETLGSPAWLAIRATPWSSRVRPSFCNTTRVMLRRLPSQADELGSRSC